VPDDNMPHLAKHAALGSAAVQAEIAVLRHRIDAPTKRDQSVRRLVSILYGADAVASLLACDVLGSRGGADAVVPLVETVLWSDPDGGALQRELRVSALAGLRELAPDDDMVVSTFMAASRDPDPDVAWPAVSALGDCMDSRRRAIRALASCLGHDDLRVRGAARTSLGRLTGQARAA
jgi:HEAT repeat protein